ncbi:MAG: M48 family metalloprotease [Bdellovibrionales bacterium]|nr:M48 family metalloprotease [Bdellovibrionales bacterium]
MSVVPSRLYLIESEYAWCEKEESMSISWSHTWAELSLWIKPALRLLLGALVHLYPMFDLGWGIFLPFFFVLGVIGAGIPALVLCRSIRESIELPWHERARTLYPISWFLGTAQTLFLIFVLIVSGIFYGMRPHEIPGVVFVPLCSVSGYVGVLAVGLLAIPRRIWKHFSWSVWIREHVVALLTFGFFVVPFVLVPKVFGNELPPLVAQYILPFLLLAFLSYFGVHHLFYRLFLLYVPENERTRSIATEASRLAGLSRVPKTYVLRTTIANAFALQSRNAIGFTEPALRIMSDCVLIGVALHELAHLKEGRGLKALRYLPLAIYIGYAASMTSIQERFGTWIMFGGLFLVVFIVRVVASAISKPLEERADEAVKNEASAEYDKDYANALVKLYEYNNTPAVLPGKHYSHPDLYDRVVKLGLSLDFERPKPPRMIVARLSMVFLIVFTFLVNLGVILSYAGYQKKFQWNSYSDESGSDDCENNPEEFDDEDYERETETLPG